jgi:hypothetical protein
VIEMLYPQSRRVDIEQVHVGNILLRVVLEHLRFVLLPFQGGHFLLLLLFNNTHLSLLPPLIKLLVVQLLR